MPEFSKLVSPAMSYAVAAKSAPVSQQRSMPASFPPELDSCANIPLRCNCYQFDFYAHLFGISRRELNMDPPLCIISPRSDTFPQLLAEGKSVFKVNGDGNCLFRSISKFFFGHEEFHSQIRSSIVHFMKINEHAFSSFVSSCNTSEFSTYLLNMSETAGQLSSWGTQTEVFALATMLQTSVYIYCEYGGSRQWALYSPLFKRSISVSIPYVSILHAGTHYDAIKPTDGFCVCKIPLPKLRYSGMQHVRSGSPSRINPPKSPHIKIPSRVHLPQSPNITRNPIKVHVSPVNPHNISLAEFINRKPSQGEQKRKRRQSKLHSNVSELPMGRANIYSHITEKIGKDVAHKMKIEDPVNNRPSIDIINADVALVSSKFDCKNVFPEEISSPQKKSRKYSKMCSVSELIKRCNQVINNTSIKSSTKQSASTVTKKPEKPAEEKVTIYPDVNLENSSKKTTLNIHESMLWDKLSKNIIKEHSYSTKLPPPEVEMKLKSVTQFAQFHKEISVAPDLVCDSCLKYFYPSLQKVNLSINSNISSILKPILSQENNNILLCNSCNTKVKKGNVPPQSMVNDLLPGAIPAELNNLNHVEQRLISQVHAYMKLVILPYGQSALNGQSINFPFDLDEMLREPLKKDGLILIQIDAKTPNKIPKEFIADIKKVNDALSWLKKNNPLYACITSLEDCHTSSVVNLQSKVADTHLPSNEMPTTSLLPANTNISENSECVLVESGVIQENPSMPKIDYSTYITGQQLPCFKMPCNVYNPINTFSHTTLEQLAFPNLFPYGVNGLRTPRLYSISHLKYVQSRLLSSDNRWSASLPYLFWVTNLLEKKQLSDNISIAMKIRTSKSAKRSTPLTAGMVKASLRPNPDFPENYYGFMRNIRGSPAYWNRAKLDLNAMINALGPPTWFLTLSANDMHWIDLMSVLCKMEGLSSDEKSVKSMIKSEKVRLMNKNPITTARHFSRRFHQFVHKLLLSDCNPIGTISHYFWRIEFQMRGSPHIHSLWWIEGAPNIDTEEGRSCAPQFIDNYVSTHIPPVAENNPFRNKVLTFQTHKHTGTCAKYQRNNDSSGKCRFDFPQPVVKETKMKNQKQFQSSPKCYFIERQRGAEYINPYNPIILNEWEANMDIQFVGCVKGAAAYVCSYICKRESDNLRSKLTDVQRLLPDSASMRQKLMKFGNVFLTHRQLSAQEAAFKTCGLPLRSSNVQVMYLDIKPASMRSRILVSSRDLSKISDEDTDIFVKNVYDRYSNRPKSDIFENMTLAHFVANYTTAQKTKGGTERFDLLDNMGLIRKRLKPVIIRTPKLSPTVNEDIYYMSMLILHHPWRTENELLLGFDSAKDSFEAKRIINVCKPTDFADQLEKAVFEIQSKNDVVVNDYIAPFVAPNIEAFDNDIELVGLKEMPEQDIYSMYNIGNEEVIDDIDIHVATCTFDEPQGDALHQVEVGNSEGADMLAIKAKSMCDQQFETMITSLNSDQTLIFNYIKKQIKHQYDGEFPHIIPFHLFISGPGGTGKSYLIDIIREYIHRVTNNPKSTVTTAPTGVAAFTIHGITLHRALCLPVQHGASPNLNNLTGIKLEMLRKFWKDVNTLIIDEISMVSYNMLVQINSRLNKIYDIKDTNVYFGGLNIIAVGDFYQLPPVHGSFVFNPHVKTALGIHLWRDLFHCLELNIVKRQTDSEFKDMLSRIRTGDHHKHDTTLLVELARNSVMKPLPVDNNTMFLYPRLSQCNERNNLMLKQLSKSASVYTICAEHHLFSSKNGVVGNVATVMTNNMKIKLLPEDDRDCAGLSRELQIADGAIIMLRRNINTPDGLVNGARGVIKEIVWKSQKKGLPEAIYVEFFDCTIGHQTKAESGLPFVPIYPISAIFFGRRSSIIQRTQLPISLSWACSIHKVQGLTLDSVAVDLGDNVFSDGMSYVALSRVKTLNGIHLIDFKPCSVRSSMDVKVEMSRLKGKTILAP